ncbi:hypothetical protein ANSO36C_10430 [Nostoc cf. commune SO-36]|uniref:Uncharacterized protein n=1 Tax=Nostoc cf. commune SO-36 TaxID=449208 RepID=A0ABM7YXA1_NOSCO|nr:hypothetical protein [Nostoc commune]BDI15241.1 hypothetical protein ANSO36C_10430 [Nostoc cf. commune SO-36]
MAHLKKVMRAPLTKPKSNPASNAAGTAAQLKAGSSDTNKATTAETAKIDPTEKVNTSGENHKGHSCRQHNID